MRNEIIRNLKMKRYGYIAKMCLARISPKLVENFSFFKTNKKLINFENPITIDEKLRVLKCTEYYKNDLVTRCCDKYLVRKYVESKGLASILNELIGVYNRPEEIDWNVLPEKYVLKCNHGSGYNIVVTDSDIDERAVSKKLNAWLHENFGILTSEYQYVDISPLIICETYLGDENGVLPVDYKFFCSRGHMICAMIIVERGKDKTEPVVFVDDEYNEIPELSEFVNDNFKKLEDYKPTKPKSYESMIEYARILSEDFPFVRVDFYEVDGNVIFGELTFTPAGCDFSFLSIENRTWFGNQIVLD
jgi:hypothetical protein